MLELAVDVAVLVAQPEAGVLDDVELAVGIERLAVAAGLVVRAGALDRGVVLRDVEVDGPRPQRASVILRSAVVEVFWSDQSKFSGRMRSSGAL